MNNNIYDLIASLSKNEKAFYIRHSKKLNEKTPSHIKLFSIISKENIDNDGALNKRLKRLSHLKKYLFDDIIDYLIFYNRKKTYSNPSYTLLRSNIMVEKGLIEEAIINQNRLLIELRESPSTLDIAHYLLTSTVNISLKTSLHSTKKTNQEDILRISKEFSNKLSILKERNDLFILHLEIKKVLENAQKSSTEKEKFCRKLIDQNLYFKIEYNILSTINCSLMAVCLINVYLFQGNYISLAEKLESINKVVIEDRTYENSREKYDTLRLIAIGLSMCYSALNKKDLFLKHLEFLKTASFEDRPNVVDALIDHQPYVLQLEYALDNKCYDLGTQLKDELLESKFSTHEKARLTVYIMCCYVGERDYENAININNSDLEEILKKEYPNYFILYKILKILIHIGLNNFTIALSESRALTYLNRKKHSFEFLELYTPIINSLYTYCKYYDEMNNKVNRQRLLDLSNILKSLVKENKGPKKIFFRELLGDWCEYQLSLTSKRKNIFN